MVKLSDIALLVTFLLIGCFFVVMGITLHPITPILCIVAGCGIFSFVTFFFFDLLALEKSRKRAAMRDGRMS